MRSNALVGEETAFETRRATKTTDRLQTAFSPLLMAMIESDNRLELR